MNDLTFYSHKECLIKDNGINHPERKERLETIIKSVHEIKKIFVQFKDAPIADFKNINLVHPNKYVQKLLASIPQKGLSTMYEEPYADTFLCPNSKNAILRACGSGIAAADDLIKNNIKKIFCGVRPPGHHAETIKLSFGFCFLNNIAVCARYLQSKYDVNKIAIIDFDVHHGNGTQEIFYNDETVAYASIHQSPLFPGSGLEEEIGVGNIFNAPIKGGTNSKEFHETFDHKIIDKIDKFKPEIILISAGFDAHYRDPLAQVNLESHDFNIITKKIVEIANLHSKGRIISFLEGGYSLEALNEGVKEHIKGLL